MNSRRLQGICIKTYGDFADFPKRTGILISLNLYNNITDFNPAGLQVPQKQPKRKRFWRNHGSCIRLRRMHKDHVWSCDFVADRTSDGRVFRMLKIIDEQTRECLAIDVTRMLKSEDILKQRSDLFVCRGVPEYIRSDNGS